MATRHHPPSGDIADRLEALHHTDLEAITVQMRAVGRALESLAAAVEALATSLPGGVPAMVTDRLEEVRWQLKDLR